MNAKNPKFAIPPKGCPPYLTAGKKYEIITKVISDNSFIVVSNNGNKLFCTKKYCAHLGGKNWILRNK